MGKIVLYLTIACAFLVASVAHSDTTVARQAFEEGTSLFEAEKYEEAAAAFRKSYEEHPHWKVLYNIGQCEAEARQYESAIDAFEKFLSEGGDQIDAKQQKKVKDELVRLKGKQAYQEGTALFKEEQFLEAAAAFRRAYDINPHWKILYNIAQCDAAAGHYGKALEGFERYLALGADNIDMVRQREIEEEVDRLQRLVGYVNLTAPAGAVIYVDGEQRGTAPLPGKLMIVASVTHELKVVLNDEILTNRKIQVNGRQSISLAVQEKTESNPKDRQPEKAQRATNTEVAQSSKPPRQTQWRKRLMPTSIALMATGGASIAASLVVGAVGLKRQKDLEDSCSAEGCDSKDFEKNRSIDSLAKAGNVLLISGAALAIGGGVMFWVVKRRLPKERLTAVTPVVGLNFGGVLVTGRF